MTAAARDPGSPEREAFYKELKSRAMGPLWELYRSTLTKTPAAREQPYLWPWEVVRPQLVRAGELVTTEEAERRVLMFLNPGNAAGIGATATLYAAMQLIRPGESARAHRHTPTALRFVVEGEGAFTCVNGEKVVMSPGDLVLTPPMVWHDHGNEGRAPVMWLDGLDIPVMLALNCMFLEDSPAQRQTVTMAPRYSQKLYGRSLLPASDDRTAEAFFSPVYSYPWQESRAALDALRSSSPPDAYEGYMLRYSNPVSGGEVLNSIGCRLQLLDKGSRTRAHRHTTSAVYHVADGSGYSILNGIRFPWRKGDTFAVPIWCWHEHAAAEESVLFSMNDEPVIRSLGHLREEAYGESGGHQEEGQTFSHPE